MLHAPSDTGSDYGYQTVSSDHEQNEFMAHLSEKREKVLFYQRERTSYPVLYQMAEDFLAMPALSAPAKGLFSRMADAITKKRNRISSVLMGLFKIPSTLRKTWTNAWKKDSGKQLSGSEDTVDYLLSD